MADSLPQISFEVSPDERQKMEALAAQEERTLSGQAAYLFRKFIFPELDSLLSHSPSPSPSAD